MIHGRFQPFHNGHLEYLRGAAARCDEIFVGITNPDPERIKPESADPLRHLPESNPYTYVERLLMVEAAAADAGIAAERLHVIPFPVNEPELREAGYEVVVLDEGAEKELSGADVREALRSGGDWEALVPPGVADVLRRVERVPV
jgi:nicotinamide-nucleotide adenylyltransferase